MTSSRHSSRPALPKGSPSDTRNRRCLARKPIPACHCPSQCPQCGVRMPNLIFFPPVIRRPARWLMIFSVPLMVAWCIGFFLFSPVHLLAAGNWVVILFMAFLYLGPGLLLVLAAMALRRERHASCDKCGYTLLVEAPNMLGWIDSTFDIPGTAKGSRRDTDP